MITKEIREKALKAHQDELKREKSYDLKCRNSSIKTLKSELDKKLGIKNPRIYKKNIRFFVQTGVYIGLIGTFKDTLSAISTCPECKKEMNQSVRDLKDLGQIIKHGVDRRFHICIKPITNKTHEQQIVDKLYELLNLLGLQ